MKPESKDASDLLPEGLEGLSLDAPSDTLDRFRKRASLLTGARFVLERQIFGFWIVLNTLLKLLFKHVNIPVAPPDQAQSRRYRQAVKNSKEGRP